MKKPTYFNGLVCAKIFESKRVIVKGDYRDNADAKMIEAVRGDFPEGAELSVIDTFYYEEGEAFVAFDRREGCFFFAEPNTIENLTVVDGMAEILSRSAQCPEHPVGTVLSAAEIKDLEKVFGPVKKLER